MITFFFVMNISSVSAITIVLLTYFVLHRNIFQTKSENLFLNILPKEIAAILKNESHTIADHYQDLWGDAVNTASRMESHSDAGIIQITRDTYELIKDDFICEPRGTIKVKGKGEMEVWSVMGPRENSQPQHEQFRETQAVRH
jgi:hypothetical protein